MKKRNLKGLLLLALLAIPLILGASCAGKEQAKYVFLFIGDGMAQPQIIAAEIFSAARSSDEIKTAKLSFTQFPIAGLTTTYDAGSFITDSASAATAIATGRKTLNGIINMSPDKTQTYKTIAQYAKESGRKIGIITTVTLNHATPSGFYGFSSSRNDMYALAVQAANSDFDYFAGGAFQHRTGRNKDQTDAIEIAKNNGYTYIDTKAEFDALKPGAGKVIAVSEKLREGETMPYEIDRKPGEVSLADLTRKGIEMLDNPKGFFMMIEGGKIDWAGHANDAGANIHDVLALDAAVSAAVEFAKKNPKNTLIVVTGDHETGGMTIGFAGTHYDTHFEKIALQTRSFAAFNEEVLKPFKENASASSQLLSTGQQLSLNDLLPAIKESFGIDFDSLTAYEKQQIEFAFQRTMKDERIRPVEEDRYLLYGGYEPLTVKLTQILNQTAGIGWTTYSHTGLPVTTFASGARAEIFGGYYDNTDIFYKLASAMNIKVE